MSYIKEVLSINKINLIRGLRKYLEKISNHNWYNFPFGKIPRAKKEKYLELADQVDKKKYPNIDEFEKTIGYCLEQKWLKELALHTQIVIKSSELCYQHGRVLYSILSKYLSDNPTKHPAETIKIWETGTARGFSALCMAKALSDQLRSGIIFTFDVLPHDIEMYWNCIDDFDKPKTRANLIEKWKDLVSRHIIFQQGDTFLELPKVRTQRINFAFLDGSHNYDDLIFEFKQIKDFQIKGDIIVFDDYSPKKFPGLVKAVDEICSKYGYDRTEITATSERGYIVAKKI